MARIKKSDLPELHIDIGSHNVNPIFDEKKDIALWKRAVKKEFPGVMFKKVSDNVFIAHVPVNSSRPSEGFYPVGQYNYDRLGGTIYAGKGNVPSRARATNPAPRIGTARPRRKSQITGKTPSKRLVKRRTANKKPGYFPNPSTSRDEKYMVILGNAIRVAEGKTRDKQVAQARLSYVQGLVSAGAILGALKPSEAELMMENLRNKLNAS